MIRIHVTLDVRSDFHIGTGHGRGRVVDATCARDANGVPILPGSTLKGLVRWEARALVDALGFAQWKGAVEALFGAEGTQAGKLVFGPARPEVALGTVATGRSGRDRTTGRAQDDRLFRFEDAAGGTFHTTVEAAALTDAELVLALAALRRISGIGGQRHRGKGETVVAVSVEDWPDKGLRLPSDEPAFAELWKAVADGTSSLAAVPPERAPSEATPAVSNEEWEVRFLAARAMSPLVLGEAGEAGNLVRSLPHVPGTSVRGALAQLALASGWGDQEPRFQALFARDGVHFGPLYQSHERGSLGLPFPAPRSLVCCKHVPGLFEGPGARTGGHGVVDLLRDVEPPTECKTPGCEAPLRPLGGFLQVKDRGGQTLVCASGASLGHSQHVAIDPTTARAEKGKLFGYETVGEGTALLGVACGPAHYLRALDALFGEQDVSLRVGRARTRGLGALHVRLVKPGPSKDGVLGLLARTGPWQPSDTFTITLLADLIAVDALLRPVTCLGGAALWDLLGGTGNAPFEIERGFAGTRTVAGWNGVAGRPRSVDVALVAGSCWRLAFKATATTEERENAVTLLRTAESRGLGLRRGEGFGRIALDLPDLSTRYVNGKPTIDAAFPADVRVWTELPAKPSHLRPSPHRTGIVSREVRALLQAVPAEDRAGLARVLAEVAQAPDRAAALYDITTQRDHRRKQRAKPGAEGESAKTETDQVLTCAKTERCPDLAAWSLVLLELHAKEANG